MNLKKLVLPLCCTLLITACNKDKNNPDTPSDKTTTDILDVPEKSGKNIRGVVYVDDKTPVAGVTVSDGVSVTKTDANGKYYLYSTKQNGYVFISIPSGYAVANNKIYPKFFEYTKGDKSVSERFDFKLTKTADKEYVVMTLADIHLAGRNQDCEHYQNWFLKDIKTVIDGYKNQGKDVYCVTLGDQSWNTYWFATDIPAPFTLQNTMGYIDMLGATTFNTMGNHDNDPKEASDFIAEAAWRRLCGPTYYSFNLGKIHYVVLDNIVYTNPTPGSVNDDCYEYYITDTQLNWLRADLANVKDKNTPVYVMAHCAMHKKPKVDASGKVTISTNWKNAQDVATLLKDFKEVNVFTGHSHINWSCENPSYSNIREYNVGSVCATWWWSGKNEYPGNHVCRDGSVGGYRVLEVSGDKLSTYYKSIGYDSNYQFRTYDLNQSQITAAKYAPNTTNTAIKTEIDKVIAAETAAGIRKSNWYEANNRNEVLINVFAYDPRWKVEVTEAGKQLEVNRENAFDPLHIVSLMCYRLKNKGSITTTFTPTASSHFFRVTASSPTSTLEIKVTDPYGRVSTETMVRPKALTTDMR